MKNIIENIWYFLKCEIPEFMGNWRLIPRVLMAMYAYVFYSVITWFMAMPDPTNAQAGFVSVIVGAGAAWFGLYTNSGLITKKGDGGKGKV